MKKRVDHRNHKLTAAAALLLAAVLLAGCGNITQSTAGANTANAATSASVSGSSGTSSSASSSSKTSSETSAGTSSDLFTERDLTQSADLSEAEFITVSNGQTVTVSKAGVYVLSGSAENARVIVNAGAEDKVQLVLDGLNISNRNQACILVESADKVFITSAEGSENSLSVTGKFSSDEDAVIFSRDDLVLNGLGTVTVSSANDGIRSNDDLKLTGGSWNVTATGTAMKAHDSICACGGTFVLTAGSDGLHAEDNDDNTTGSIVISGGSFVIKAGDDGVHATTTATVSGGSLTVSAAEGIEATQVAVSGGEVSIQASDDGINAGKKSNALSVNITISGGSITIVMGQGDTDGIDSNGDLVISGGTIDITAQSPFDYDGSCSYTGGTIIVNGTQTDSISNQMMGGGMGGQFGGQPGGQGGWQGGGRH